jgi:hypothetical protein
MVLGDLLTIVKMALILAFLVLPAGGRAAAVEPVALVFLLRLPVWELIAFWFGLYHDFERRLDRSLIHEVGRLIVAGGHSGFATLDDRAALIQEAVERGISVDLVTGGPESLFLGLEPGHVGAATGQRRAYVPTFLGACDEAGASISLPRP